MPGTDKRRKTTHIGELPTASNEMAPPEKELSRPRPSYSDAMQPEHAMNRASVDVPTVIVHQPDAHYDHAPPYFSSHLASSPDWRQGSSNSENMTSNSANWTNPKTMLPGLVPCSLNITFEERALPQIKDLWIEWKDENKYKEAYAKIEEVSLKCLHAHNVLDSRRPYLKHGSVIIISEEHVEPPGRMENPGEWDEVLSILISKFSSQPHKRFRLEISRDYSALQVAPIGDEPYAVSLREQIWKKTKKNFDGLKYIPRIDLFNITSEDAIRRVIEMDHSIMQLSHSQDFEKESFIQDVMNRAPKLFVVCVLHQLEMKCLWKLLKGNIDDEKMPLEEKHCPDPKYGPSFSILVEMQGVVLATVFEKAGEDKNFHSREVVPVIFDRNKDEIVKFIWRISTRSSMYIISSRTSV